MNHRAIRPVKHSRAGVTLTEVLMSMLIMAIGVIFVATLFPASVLRSIQASQMTSATIARYNAEAIIDTLPALVHDPDGNGNRREHFQVNNPDSRLTRNYLVDPYGFYTHQQDGSATDDSIHAWFGVKATAAGEVQSVLPLLRRFGGGVGGADAIVTGNVLETRANAAAALTFANDRWDRVIDVDDSEFDLLLDGGGEPVGVTIPNRSLSTVVPGISRIQIFDQFGRSSQTYPVLNPQPTNANPGEVYWDATRLPNDFRPDAGGIGGPGRVVIENDQRLFNWFLTVRKDTDGRANIDVVVTANRRVAPENEHAYSAVFQTGSSVVWVNSGAWDTPSPAPEPLLKKGGYVFDVVNARWYRIQEVDLVGGDMGINPGLPFPTGDFNIRLEIEGEVRAPGTNANLDRDGDGTFDGFAVFLPGIIDVFPLASRTLPELSE